MTEKRKANRARLDIYLNKFVSGVPYMTRSADISPQGISLAHLIEPQLEGRQVGLQFQLPDTDEVIYAEGEVVRGWVQSDAGASADGSGIRFTLLTERHRRLIDRYVTRHTS